MTLRTIHIRFISVLALLSGFAPSCTKPESEPTAAPAAGQSIRVQMEGFDGAATAHPDDERIETMNAYLFEAGVLTQCYENLSEAAAGYGLQLARLSGRLYLVANAEADTYGSPQPGLSESEWLARGIGTAPGGEAVRFASGSLDLGTLPAGTTLLPIAMKRGVARFDLRILVAGEASVESIVFDNIALEGSLFAAQTALSSESGPTGELLVRPETPFTASRTGIAYLYEQESSVSVVRIEALIDGKSYTLEKSLPAEIRRNTVYTVTLRRNIVDADVELNVEPWNTGDETPAVPDLDHSLTVDLTRTEIPDGVVVAEGRTEMTFHHLRTEMSLAIDCNDELEVLPLEGYPLTIEPIANDGGIEGINRFLIRKELYAPGMEEDLVELRFHRKGLANNYPEDRITLRLEANPSRIEGDFAFANPNYEFDFGRYIDNELGRIILAPGKELVAEFDEGEDRWIDISAAEGEERVVRIVAGWRPNDPTANGRRQSARLVIRNASDQSQREEYTVVRRNWGLPVTWFHGVWWCKYNARGDSRDFEDQILSSADPAAMAGKSVFDYLTSCSAEEYYDLWCWAYQGDSGNGLKVVDRDGVLVMDNFTSNNSSNINRLPADALSPDGYELPTMEEFNRMFDATDYIWMMWDGSHKLREPWEGHATVTRRQKRRNDLTIGTVAATDLIYIVMKSADFPEDEGVTWYGPGAQWNADGIMHSNHYNNILFSVHSPEGQGWYMGGGMGNLYMTKNGAGNNDTRILRFKKSPVEYIY